MFYVVDTSVILSDPKSLERMSDKHVVIPMTVLQELEFNRHDADIGYEARSALRIIEKYRENGDILAGINTADGGSFQVYLDTKKDLELLPDIYQSNRNDNRILSVASVWLSKGLKAILLTNDLPLRIKASTIKIESSPYSDDLFSEEVDTVRRVPCDPCHIDKLYSDGRINAYDFEDFPINTMLILTDDSGSALARKVSNEDIELVPEIECQKIKGRNAKQRFALDLLTDPNVGIVSLGGQAGSGKTVMALAAGIESVNDRFSSYDKVLVFRPIEAVGGQELGFLPGTQEEKMHPWRAAVDDALSAFMPANEVERMKQKIEVLPLTHIRGRTLRKTYVIVDEAQNLDLTSLVTVLTRIGEGSKVILTYDVSQRDNHRVGKHDGVSKIIDKLSGSPLFAHITLDKTERSPIAALVADAFDL